MPPHLYFAYGSNMLLARLRARVPGARRVGVALLRAHALRWHKVGRDGSGKCDIVATDEPGQQVHGVIYEIPPGQKPALDLAEGLGQGYDELQVQLEGPSGPLQAFSYRATRTRPDALPFTWYRALVVAGAIENGLPQPYVEALQRVPASLDRDPDRHASHMRLAGMG